MPPCPLPQSDEFARTLRALGTEARFVTMPGTAEPCLIQTRRLPLVGHVNLISRGADLGDALRSFPLDGPLLVTPAKPVPRPSGFLRITRPQTIALLPLSNVDAMRHALHQNWRHSLTKADRQPLDIRNDRYCPTRHAWLIEADQRQQRLRGYRNWPVRFLDAYARENPGKVRTITAGTPSIAGMVILCHPPWATYHIAITDDDGRRRGAHPLMLWHTMRWLATRGYTVLDLGKLSGPPGLDRFKRRTGAVVKNTGGTWLRLPHALHRRRQSPSIQPPSGQKA